MAPTRLPKRCWYTSKLTDVSMKVRLQTFNYSPSFTEALSIKTEAPSIKYSVLNPQRPSPARTASRTRSRETPEPGDTDALRRDAHDARLEMYIVLACLSKTCPKQASREPRFYHFPVTREAPTTDITTDQTRVRPRRCELAIYLIKCYEGIY